MSSGIKILDLNFSDHGAQLFTAALPQAELTTLHNICSTLPANQAGIRIASIPALQSILAGAGHIAAYALGMECFPVRAIYFDKSAINNWALGWHQDRTIVVQERVDVAGFNRWTIKSGMHHVEPPFNIFASMATLRIHLDPVPAANAPLLVAPASHKRGKIPTSQIAAVVSECGTFECIAESGDIWLYSTPILHASKSATQPSHRRVLQVDYSAVQLPSGLRWLGV